MVYNRFEIWIIFKVKNLENSLNSIKFECFPECEVRDWKGESLGSFDLGWNVMFWGMSFDGKKVWNDLIKLVCGDFEKKGIEDLKMGESDGGTYL